MILGINQSHGHESHLGGSGQERSFEPEATSSPAKETFEARYLEGEQFEEPQLEKVAPAEQEMRAMQAQWKEKDRQSQAAARELTERQEEEKRRMQAQHFAALRDSPRKIKA